MSQFANEILDKAFEQPMWLALYENSSEVTCPDCPRQRFYPSKADNGEVRNETEMIYKMMPKCKVTDLVLFYEETSGNPLWNLPLVIDQEFNDGNTLVIEPGDIRVTNPMSTP